MTERIVPINVPELLVPIFNTNKRYVCIDGGRGSAKSWSAAEFCLWYGKKKKSRILCCREIQNSIKDSVHKLLSDKIQSNPEFNSFYTIQRDSIVGANGTEFIFKGLWNNLNSIKSIEGIDLCWVEEGQSVSRASLKILIPTIRKFGSQIIFTYNPTYEDDPVHVDYKLSNRDDVLRITVNWWDNPWFYDTPLRDEMLFDYRTSYDTYLHVWCGKCVVHSNEQVFHDKFIVQPFDTPSDIFPYFGIDWGFAQDPFHALRCFIQGKNLYIDYEKRGIGIEIDALPSALGELPDSHNYPIRADKSRPETISYLQNHGYANLEAAKQGQGSVEDGVSFLRGFEKIIIHERCKGTAADFRMYKHKVDPHTGAISAKIILDKNNHGPDACRYAIEPVMIKYNMSVFDFFKSQADYMESHGAIPQESENKKEDVPVIKDIKSMTDDERKKEIERLQSVTPESFLNSLKRF